MSEWDEFCSQLGYKNEGDMWKDLYITKDLSITDIARKLNVSRNVVRAALARTNIPPRKRGGPNNSRLVMTEELLEEVKKNGVMAVARRLGLDYSTLYKRLRLRGISVKSLRAPAPVETPETS